MDAGKQLVDYIYETMSIDGEWSTRVERGFTWWGGPLKQTIWADQPHEDLGFRVSRVHARTDVVKCGPLSEASLEFINNSARLSTLSGPFLDGDLLQFAACVYVHDQTLPQWKTVFGVAALLQVAEANIKAKTIAPTLGAQVARSEHPTSGAREQLDQILGGIDALIAPAGRTPSRFMGDDLEKAEKTARSEVSMRSSAGPTSLTAEFPFGDETALLRMVTDQPHPRLGNGLLVTLTLPGTSPIEDLRHFPLYLNRLEIEGDSRTPFLGSWCIDPNLEGHLSYVSFYPNFSHMRGLPLNILEYAARRARWVYDHLTGTGTALEDHVADRGSSSIWRILRRFDGK